MAKVASAGKAPFIAKDDKKRNGKNPRKDASLRRPDLDKDGMDVKPEICPQIVDGGAQERNDPIGAGI